MIQNINKIKKEQILRGVITKAEHLLKEVEAPSRNSNVKSTDTTEELNLCADDWRNYIRGYIQNNWIKRKELATIIGGKDIMEHHDKLIKALNMASDPDKEVLLIKNKEKALKNQGAKISLLDRVNRRSKPWLHPRIFIPQGEIDAKIRR